jgi:hypothetical protein
MCTIVFSISIVIVPTYTITKSCKIDVYRGKDGTRIK